MCVLALLTAACSKPEQYRPSEPAANILNPAIESHAEELTVKVFDKFDTNRDGKLSESEYLRAVIVMFDACDYNHDDLIDKDHCPGNWDDETIEADSDKDQSISFAEAVKFAIKTFEKRDTTHDGFLSRDEVKASIAAKLAVQQAKHHAN